jgi:predicted DNA-binding protein YlxM (UPF0122 family)
MTDEEYKQLDHISEETIRDDIGCTLQEIEDYEMELEILKKNPQKNRLDIYLREGKILSRQAFIEKLEGVLVYRILVS